MLASAPNQCQQSSPPTLAVLPAQGSLCLPWILLFHLATLVLLSRPTIAQCMVTVTLGLAKITKAFSPASQCV